jgi:predicted ATP-grasp superfamily ATP-dependent carboligase
LSRRSEIPEVDIVETEKVELKEPLLIFGFVGAGLVAQIAVNQIIDQLNMKEIAHVRSRYIPPSVVFIDGKLKHPFRVYLIGTLRFLASVGAFFGILTSRGPLLRAASALSGRPSSGNVKPR